MRGAVVVLDIHIMACIVDHRFESEEEVETGTKDDQATETSDSDQRRAMYVRQSSRVRLASESSLQTREMPG